MVLAACEEPAKFDERKLDFEKRAGSGIVRRETCGGSKPPLAGSHSSSRDMGLCVTKSVTIFQNESNQILASCLLPKHARVVTSNDDTNFVLSIVLETQPLLPRE